MKIRCCLLALLFLGAWAGRARVEHPATATTAVPLGSFPNAIGSWRGGEAPLDPEVVKVAGVDDHLNRYYRSLDGELGLYVGYYNRQQQGESLHSPLYCLPGAGWQPKVTSRFDLRVPGDAVSRPVNKLVVQRGLDQLLVLYWYQTPARVTANEYLRKLFLIRDAFVTGRTDVALVRIIAPMDYHTASSEDKAFSSARSFAELVLPEVQQRLFHE
jgi:EpsI family protein